ncbi:hypothetical protein [Kitasatospora sp. A2-31]|uniref:hypothetical protein n=1 Tax=Kitasatospora sp. A2-31 TaxID=2916414 RepID=UPI001EEA7AC0|nr:hypothetical protein [Kitasatospora sp. A2-31]MCG6494315.1 hypothetical protein [Kitasatospora sp. A2-31]
MNHRTGADQPSRRGQDRGDRPGRAAVAQLELMAEDIRRLTLALHDLSRHERSRHERSRHPAGPVARRTDTLRRPAARRDADPAGATG